MSRTLRRKGRGTTHALVAELARCLPEKSNRRRGWNGCPYDGPWCTWVLSRFNQKQRGSRESAAIQEQLA